jgi:hypothetical protein
MNLYGIMLLKTQPLPVCSSLLEELGNMRRENMKRGMSEIGNSEYQIRKYQEKNYRNENI